MLDMDGSKPIYVQIAEWIETEIIDGTLGPDAKVYSQYKLAELFNINPATAGKGLSILLENGIVYQKRGLGTFVSPDGRDKLRSRRKEVTLRRLIQQLLDEAELLGVDDHHLQTLIEAERKRKKGDSE